ncbi:MAG: ABC transporter ATP-binding protein [Oscillospiraceae bacterium]|nr:ABC transporter ATP-binding protein [Oscillospiraceae bacterium]
MKTKNETHLPLFGVGLILPFLKKYKKKAIIMVVLGLIASGIDIIWPIYNSYVLDNYVNKNTIHGIGWFVLAYIGTALLSSFVNYISCSYAMQIEVNVNKDLRNKVFKHLQTLSFSFYNQNSVGYIHSRVMSDTSRIGTLVSWSLMDSVWHLSYLLGVIVVMFAVNAKLTLLIVTIIPVIVILFSIFQDSLIKVNREVREINSQITGDLNEAITGAKTIKSLVIEEKMYDDFRKDTSDMKRKAVNAARIRGAFQVTLNMASSLALSIVLWKGGYLAAEDVGTFSLFMTYAEGMMEPVRWIIDAISDLITTQVNIERYSKILNTESDVKDIENVINKYGDSFEPNTKEWEDIKGDIEFRDVSFKYPDGDEYVLEHFNLNIPFGTNLAIVGETGAGKSTLANLICRFYEPTSGEILLDGKDLRERSQLWLHSSIGFVQQTPHLFSGTIRENLLYGNPDATEEDIIKALELVSAKDLVESLNKGLDTDIGEGGDTLSTGEKQLIAFARAIISDPRILILDEATANIDTVIEQKIQNAIDNIISGRTSIVIAHRLSTVKNADIILVVKEGKIIESGTHKELLKARGYYHNLYTKQYEDEATSALLE